MQRSGFADVAPEFTRQLAGIRSYGAAERLVAREGTRLWRRAVDRVQGRGPAGGDLSRDDDRPLYWARLGLTRELRLWEPEFELTETNARPFSTAWSRPPGGRATSTIRRARASRRSC